MICDLQTILLMAMASKLDLLQSEYIRFRRLAASSLFLLFWCPDTLEALAPVFFNLDGQNSNDCFCSFLIHWGGTGILQVAFEVFVLILASKGRWRAILSLLSCTPVGEALLVPALISNDSDDEISGFLPEVSYLILNAIFP